MVNIGARGAARAAVSAQPIWRADFSESWTGQPGSGAAAAAALSAVLSELRLFNYCAKVKTGRSENAYPPGSGIC